MPKNDDEESLPKRKLWVKWFTDGQNGRWVATKAQGFYPETEFWSAVDLRAFLKENSDVDVHLSY